MEQLEEHEQHQQSDSISQTDAVSENPLNAIDRLVETYKVPLEGAGAEIDEIRIEFEAMVTCCPVYLPFHFRLSERLVALVPCT